MSSDRTSSELPPTHTPGIFYVNSRITSPHLSADTYTRWYNTEHVPDILKTSGINAAYRYTSLAPDAKRPYLAIYPCELEFLATKEFLDIPVASDLLKDESCPEGSSFRVAEFDTRGYENVAVQVKAGRKQGPGQYLITVLFDSNAETNERLPIECALPGLVPSRTRLFKLTFVWGREEKGAVEGEGEPAKYLATHEFSEEEFSRDALALAQRSMTAKVDGYELNKAFGNVE